MPRPKFNDKIRQDVLNKTNGRCYHCNIAIFEERWDVDHYPVRYEDIENQCGCMPCGNITDPYDISNLQPSCIRCNRSHKYEKRKCWYCGHSQLRINKQYIKLFVSHLITIILGIVIGKYVM